MKDIYIMVAKKRSIFPLSSILYYPVTALYIYIVLSCMPLKHLPKFINSKALDIKDSKLKIVLQFYKGNKRMVKVFSNFLYARM